MSSLSEIKKLEDRYPFHEDELEILLRGHESLMNEANTDSFLMKLAMCSPYSYFFLPGDEMRDRVNFIEDYILPAGFPNELKAAISSDAFVDYANAGEPKALERFLEGVADTGRRGPKEAVRVVYSIIPDPEPRELVDLCFRLAVAADLIVTSSVNKQAVLDRMNDSSAATGPLTQSLLEACYKAYKDATKKPKPTKFDGEVVDFWKKEGRKIFLRWIEESVPLLPTTLSSFMHNLLFHGHPYPASRTPYSRPLLDHASDIFANHDAPLLFPLSCTSYHFGGKWHRLYSAEMDGRSFNRLEWALLGYTGPTVLIIHTKEDATLGAFASMPWKQAPDFYGDSDCFVFQLSPTLGVYRPTGKEGHFMYCNPEPSTPFQGDGRAHGIGFGGSVDEPRLFLPESLEECSAHYLDSTYQKGDLLPKEAMEKFQIKFLEVWGVGGDEVINKALRDRAEHRETMNVVINKARTVSDKSQFVKDIRSGLIPNVQFEKLQEETRGRPDFRVDDEHGGYKIDRD